MSSAGDNGRMAIIPADEAGGQPPRLLPLAAKAALHNFCFWLNTQLGRDRLAFADLIAW